MKYQILVAAALLNFLPSAMSGSCPDANQYQKFDCGWDAAGTCTDLQNPKPRDSSAFITPYRRNYDKISLRYVQMVLKPEFWVDQI